MAGSLVEGLGLAAGAAAEPALGAEVSGGAALRAQPATIKVIANKANVTALLMMLSLS
jgi:hypothetical protein